jgi:hypothetical protein
MGEPPIDVDKKLLETYFRHFDAGYYSREFGPFPDQLDLFGHYLQVGWIEGRNPCSWFDGFNYFIANPDVETRGINPFIHFLGWGVWEGRKFDAFPSPRTTTARSLGLEDIDLLRECRELVDEPFYREQIASLYRSDRVDVYAHFAFAGWRMGLRPNAKLQLSEEARLAGEKLGINPYIYQRRRLVARPSSARRESLAAPSPKPAFPPLASVSNGALLAYLYSQYAVAVAPPIAPVRCRYEPLHQLEPLPGGRFRSTGDDPQFHLIPEADLASGCWF